MTHRLYELLANLAELGRGDHTRRIIAGEAPGQWGADAAVGRAVPVDPVRGEMMGAFVEDALSLEEARRSVAIKGAEPRKTGAKTEALVKKQPGIER